MSNNVVINQTNIHQTNVDKTLTQIVYELSIDGIAGVSINNPTQYVIESGSITITNILCNNNNLYILIDTLIDNEVISIRLLEGLLKNDDGMGNVGTNNEITTSFVVNEETLPGDVQCTLKVFNDIVDRLDEHKEALTLHKNILTELITRVEEICCTGCDNTNEKISMAMLENVLIEKGAVETIKQRMKNPINWYDDEQV